MFWKGCAEDLQGCHFFSQKSCAGWPKPVLSFFKFLKNFFLLKKIFLNLVPQQNWLKDQNIETKSHSNSK